MRNLRKIYHLLPKKYKFQAIIILILLILSSIVEMIGILVLIPAFTSLDNDNIIFIKISSIFNLFENINPIYVILGFVVCVFLIKNIFLSLVVYIQTKYSYAVQIDITKRVFHKYMKNDYELIVRNSPNYYISKIINESNSLASSLFMPLINIITEVIVGIGILLIILNNSIDAAIIIIFVLSITSGVYYFYVMSRNKVLGKVKFKYERTIVKVVEQAFKFIKDLKIYRLENDYINKFTEAYYKKRDIEVQQTTLTNLPRMILEFAAIIALISVTLILTSKNLPRDQISAILVIIAASAFRILPSYNRIVAALGSVKYSENLLNEIYKLLSENTQKKYKIMGFKNSIRFDNISYSRDGVQILNLINFEIIKNSLVGISGESGSGKTTILDLLSGIIKPSSGNLYLNETLIEELNWGGEVAYVSQENLIYDSTLMQNIIMNTEYDHVRFINAIEMSCLQKVLQKHGMNCRIGYLSGGQKQRVLIARAIYRNSPIIIMDEPTSALDHETTDLIMRNLIKLSLTKTIVIVSHDSKVLSLCHKVIEI
jgi:ABC-type bacteriocin/lantibiotic exporter with double-glycine peptidase domain